MKISETDHEFYVNGLFRYRIIDFYTVFSAISQLVVCKQCESNVTFNEASNRDLGFKVAVICTNYEPSYINASPIINNYAYDINRRIIFVYVPLGVGLHGIIKFCAFMDLPRPIFYSCYNLFLQYLLLRKLFV